MLRGELVRNGYMVHELNYKSIQNEGVCYESIVSWQLIVISSSTCALYTLSEVHFFINSSVLLSMQFSSQRNMRL